jgi:exosortase
VTICHNGDAPLLRQAITIPANIEVRFLDEHLPAGSAGAIRDAARGRTPALLLVLPATMVNPPDIDAMVAAHQSGACDLTVAFNPSSGSANTPAEPAGIYVCNPAVLEHIPEKGYFDIKESLIPEMLRSGRNIESVTLQHNVGNFRTWQEYLHAVTVYGDSALSAGVPGLKLCENSQTGRIWKAANVAIDRDARVLGPVIFLNGSRAESGTVIFGPTVVGRDVRIEQDSIVANSILWDNSRVGRACQIQHCVIDYNVAVRSGSIVQEQAVHARPVPKCKSTVRQPVNTIRKITYRVRDSLEENIVRINKVFPAGVRRYRKKLVTLLATASVLLAFAWCYGPDLADLGKELVRSDEYSSGLFVPFLAVYVLWTRRRDLAGVHQRPCAWGVLALIAAQTVRFFGVFFMYGSAVRLSLVLTIAALALLLLGWPFFRRVSTILLFLCLMLPWPNRVQAAVTLPLQRWATSSSVFCLETMGYEAVQEGNLIHIGDSTVAIAEACNGLRMVTAFFVISGLVVLLAKRSWWEKAAILASSLPIALLCNTVRLTLTAVAFTMLSGENWEKLFHDFGGYAMMPLAVAIVVGELWLLTKLLTPPVREQVITARRR